MQEIFIIFAIMFCPISLKSTLVDIPLFHSTETIFREVINILYQ